jgi:hypothetical protein
MVHARYPAEQENSHDNDKYAADYNRQKRGARASTIVISHKPLLNSHTDKNYWLEGMFQPPVAGVKRATRGSSSLTARWDVAANRRQWGSDWV